jgi:hypothetical protein
MKKLLSILLATILTFSCFSQAFAATTYPFSPTEVVENFETSFLPSYDQINTDLHSTMEEAKKWSPDATLGDFTIGWADGTENGYTFTFFSLNGMEGKALHFSPILDGGWYHKEIDRPADMKYGIYNVPMRLRHLIPLIKADKTVLPTLDQLITKDDDTSIKITLKKNTSNQLFWYIEFKTSKNYMVKVSANNKSTPVFTIQELK